MRFQEHRQENEHNFLHEEDKHKEKNMKIDRQIKLMREVEKNMKNIEKEVKIVDKKHEEQEIVIENITKNQNNKLEERLAKRKKKLRKKSVELKKDNEEDPQPVIKKEELI